MTIWIVLSAIIPLVNVVLILAWALIQFKLNRILSQRLDLHQQAIESLTRMLRLLRSVPLEGSPVDLIVQEKDKN